jgi:hypothetical protein
MRRRTFLSTAAATGIGLAAQNTAAAQDQSALPAGGVPVNWLGGVAPLFETGLTWGVPWPRGTVRKNQEFTLTAADGRALPLQTWPLAYWPDGSLKWSALATVAGAGAAGPFRVTPGNARAAGAPAVAVRESADAIEIDTGKLQCRIPRQGDALIDSMTVAGTVVARHGRLACTLEDRPDPDTTRLRHYRSSIRKVTAEQSGPLRATIKIEGVYKAENGSREWLPFTVRLYSMPDRQQSGWSTPSFSMETRRRISSRRWA